MNKKNTVNQVKKDAEVWFERITTLLIVSVLINNYNVAHPVPIALLVTIPSMLVYIFSRNNRVWKLLLTFVVGMLLCIFCLALALVM